jgi:small GTP-binding protein
MVCEVKSDPGMTLMGFMEATTFTGKHQMKNRVQVLKPEFTVEEVACVRAEMGSEVSRNPPTIGVVGVSGVGKSSTLNVLFHTNRPVSQTVACTKCFEEKDLGLKLTRSLGEGLHVDLRVIDAPGLGEDMRRDPEYLAQYKANLVRCDVILWVMTARNRAVALDQMYLQQLRKHHRRIVFGINQCDLVDPLDWDTRANLPSPRQERNIAEIVKDRSERLTAILGTRPRLIPYSAVTGYNLEELFFFLIENAPEQRRWIFDGLKNFSFKDFVPEEFKLSLDEDT